MQTNFAALTTEQKTVWSRDVWKMARNASFMNQFAGRGFNSMVQRITELTKNEKGARAVMQLVTDLEGDGVVGDHDLEQREERIKAYDQVIQLDQMRNANRTTGRMADQKTTINFREQSRDVLAYWLADRMDQLAFLTLSGVSYAYKNNGALRPVRGDGQNFSELEFAGDVTAPTSGRHLQWDAGTGAYVAVSHTDLVAADKISYKALVLAKSYAKEQYMRGIRGSGNSETFHVFVPPAVMATLKLDSDYLANVRSAAPRSTSNELFAGTTSVMVDGLWIHEHRHVFNTKGAAPGQKWGGSFDVDGARVLFCGAQALGLADLGNPIWSEKWFDYDNQSGIAIAKILGLKKPKFHSIYTGQTEDFGVLALDFAI